MKNIEGAGEMLDSVGVPLSEGAGEMLDSGNGGGSMIVRVPRNLDRNVVLIPSCLNDS